MALALLVGLGGIIVPTFAESNPPFDGRPWNVSSGNLSVVYTQSSPIGAYPRTNFFEAPPSVESQVRLKNLGLVANEDYVSWGAVERVPGQWDWKQHDAMEQTLHKAGLKYVVYDWVHFPPVWIREQPEKRTLMRCMEHNKEANYLSVFDPRTIEWYDHFYKNLHEHFGNRIDDVYACILGPYGEGNYPLYVPDWVNMGHCHEGYWCGDEYAVKAFQMAMKRKYSRVGKLNKAWGSEYKSFEEVHPPKELAKEKFIPSLTLFSTPQDKRRWLDFITWYHQAIIDFTEQSLKTVLKYFPAEKVRTKPGGSSGGVNPITYGTYCPGYAKMAKGYGVVLQPADCQGAVFADKWMGTAYQFYGVKECTEPCGGLDDKNFARRMFSDASSGAAQLFTYEFESHAKDIQRYVHLFTGKSGETEVAVYCPTTLNRLGDNLATTIGAAAPLRDLCEFDVLDELLINDGALTTKRYKALIVFQAEVVDQPILDKLRKFQHAGGKVISVGNLQVKNVEGQLWNGSAKMTKVAARTKNGEWLKELSAQLAGCKGVDGKLDGLWTCRRGTQVFVFNSTDKPAKIDSQAMELAPYNIWFNQIVAPKNN
ncbi:MAG: Beta-amylase [Pedosphaera sp.]|nr:Beta-amylase [Pedosphaera sp.]